jgi:hypothetical protein
VAAGPDGTRGRAARRWWYGEYRMIIVPGEVAPVVAFDDEEEDVARRVALFADLRLINAAIARMGVACRVSAEAAGLYPTDELPALVAAARHQYLDVLYQLGGTR